MTRWHYVIGDIHGCIDELEALEVAIGRHAARHEVEAEIISVGDLVDRGPDSAAVVERFRLGQDAGTHRAVMGNHEAMMLQVLWQVCPWDAERFGALPLGLKALDALADGSRGPARCLNRQDYLTYRKLMWIAQGGMDTLRSFGCDVDDEATWVLPDATLSYLLRMPYVLFEDRFIVCHALADAETLEIARQGASGELDIEDEAALKAYRDAVESLMWRRQPPARAPDEARVHVSGHTPLRRVKRLKRRTILQIDTGCVFGRRLTAWCAEGDTLINVQASDYVV